MRKDGLIHLTLTLSNIGRIIQSATTVQDIYEVLLYVACITSGGTGGFLSVNGGAEYFDCVLGTYRKRRLGAKGGIKIWNYKIPPPGGMEQTDNVWLFKSMATGWLIGTETISRPDCELLESLNLIALGATIFIQENEKRIEGRDILTGLFNRGRFYQDIRHLTDVSRHTGHPLYLFFIDLNNFKAINDSLGHEMGDRVLKSQAFTINRTIADYGMTYRYGGDEFCVILPGISEQKMLELAKRIEISTEQAPGGIPVSASVGVAVYESGEEIETFIARADEKMYERKAFLKKG